MTLPAAEDAPADGQAHRTDPLSFLVQAIGGLRNAVLPVVAAFFAFRDEGGASGLAPALGAAIVIMALIAASTWLSWRRLTYTIGETDIRVESGVLSRAARSVPFERIQDVSLEQAFLPRLFGLVEVRFETGAGGKDELTLSFLREVEGARLRELVRERREDDGPLPVHADTSEEGTSEARPEGATVLFAMGPRRLLTFGLFEFSLAILAVLFGITQQFDFLLPFDLWDLDKWQDRLAGPGARLAALGSVAQAVGAALALILLVAVGLATGMVRTVLRDWGFLLERTAKGFRRRRGLLTRTDVTMPAHRVQALDIGTGIVRRWWGWQSLKFVSLSQDKGSSSHVVAPFAKAGEIEPIVRAAGFALAAASLDWHRATRAHRTVVIAIESGALLALSLVLLALWQAAIAPGDTDGRWWTALIPAGLAVILAVRQYWLWRLDRHAVDARQVYRRHGLLSPATRICQRVRLQSVEIRQGPLARRLGYASLHLGLAGGTFAIHGLAQERARALRDQILASIAATDFSRIDRPQTRA